MLKIFNTLGKKKQAFKPLFGKRVLMYHCGPTLYWTQHIGNLRGMVMADLIARSLRYLGYEVKLVRNYTDVGHLTSDDDRGEDKMFIGAQRESLAPAEIAAKYRAQFERDLGLLNVEQASVAPMATKYISAMQKMVSNLISGGFAYVTDLAIYFDISKAKKYNRLSGQELSKQEAGAGKGDVGDPQKKHPQDFALWFFKKGAHANALQTWPFAPYGEGFPGWHIECSAMIKELLGDTIDIHMGGIEHIPVHHTNEIAQSEAANAKPFVKYWVHNEHLLVNGKKMSKSEGTGFSLQEVIDKGFDPLDLRYFFLQAHYRSKQNFTWEALEAAKRGREHLVRQLKEIKINKGGTGAPVWDKKFIKAISDDFNVPLALGLIGEVLKAPRLSVQDKLATLFAWDDVFGLRLREMISEKGKIPVEIQELIKQREQARREKNWPLADELRATSASKGYFIEDTEEGPRVSAK